MTAIRRLLAGLRRHTHDLTVTGPEGRERYTCATCPWTHQRPPVGKAF